MQTDNRLLDDLARVASGALGVVAGMRKEVETRLREQFAHVLGDADMVGRDEFDAVQAMAAKARDEQETLAARLAAIEAKLGLAKPAKAKKKAARKKAAKKKVAKKKA